MTYQGKYSTFPTRCRWGHIIASKEDLYVWVDKRGQKGKSCVQCTARFKDRQLPDIQKPVKKYIPSTIPEQYLVHVEPIIDDLEHILSFYVRQIFGGDLRRYPNPEAQSFCKGILYRLIKGRIWEEF